MMILLLRTLEIAVNQKIKEKWGNHRERDKEKQWLRQKTDKVKKRKGKKPTKRQITQEIKFDPSLFLTTFLSST